MGPAMSTSNQLAAQISRLIGLRMSELDSSSTVAGKLVARNLIRVQESRPVSHTPSRNPTASSRVG